MDIVSHGLWGSLAFGRETRKSFWLAFTFGIAPDLFSFGIFTVSTWLGLEKRPDWSTSGPPLSESIPLYVHTLYNFTHSLAIFALVFLVVFLIRRKVVYEMLAWPLHILVDIPTHSSRFFPTPFLFPVSDFRINGHPWSDPLIFIPNVTLLIVLYCWFFILRPKMIARRKPVDFS